MTLANRSKSKSIIIFLVTAFICILLFIHSNVYRHSYIERKLVSAIDQYCKGEGECNIDLADVFSEFDWDTVSVFIAGNTLQVKNDLGVYTEASDGIVFSKNGVPIKHHLSYYGFPEDVPPLISYYIDHTDPYAPYYICLQRDHAIVHAQKYKYNDGSYKYSVLANAIS